MELEEERVGEACIVTARGRLDGASSSIFADRISGLITDQKPTILVDFTAVDFVTSAGLRAVLILLKKVKAANGSFALCGVQDSVREILDISGFTAMISIYPARSDGIAALSL